MSYIKSIKSIQHKNIAYHPVRRMILNVYQIDGVIIKVTESLHRPFLGFSWLESSETLKKKTNLLNKLIYKV